MAQGIPAHEFRTVFPKADHNLIVYMVGMGFELDDLRFYFRCCQQIFELVAEEVRNPQRPGLSFFISLFDQGISGLVITGGLVNE